MSEWHAFRQGEVRLVNQAGELVDLVWAYRTDPLGKAELLGVSGDVYHLGKCQLELDFP